MRIAFIKNWLDLHADYRRLPEKRIFQCRASLNLKVKTKRAYLDISLEPWRLRNTRKFWFSHWNDYGGPRFCLSLCPFGIYFGFVEYDWEVVRDYYNKGFRFSRQ